MIIAIDFGGTLCFENYLGIVNTNQALIGSLKELQFGNDRMILWTCSVAECLGNALRKGMTDIYIVDCSEKLWNMKHGML